MDNLLIVKKQLEEKKNQILEKNQELSDLNFRLETIKDNLNELKELKKTEQDYETIRRVERENLALLAEERKSYLFKEINIKNQNLIINNCNCEYNNNYTKLDNLIKCLLSISNKSFSRYSLFSGKSDKIKVEINKNETVIAIDKLKKSLFLSNESHQIEQNVIDEITNKMNEDLNNKMPKCFLLDENCDKLVKKLETQTNNEIFFLYEYKNDYLVLRPDDYESTIVDRTQEIINNLLCEELLEDVCKIKYEEYSSKKMKETDLNKLYQCLTEINDKLAHNSDEVDKDFLDHLKLKSKIFEINEELIDSQIVELNELYKQVIEYTPEHESIKIGILLLKDTYIKRMEFMLFEECEQRKKNAQVVIQSEMKDGNQIQIEIKKIQNEIDSLDKYINKRESELAEKNKEIEQKKEQLKLLDESRKKQDDELNNDIKKLNQELKLKENELKLVKDTSGAQKENANKLRSDIQNISSKISELQTNKENLENQRKQINESIAQSIKERDNLEKEKVKFEIEKTTKENEIKELKTEVNVLTKWIDFLDKTYTELLNNQNLFKKRYLIKKKLKDAQTLSDMYKVLTQEKELSHLIDTKLEQASQENTAKIREIFENTFKNILSEPNLIFYRDKSNNTVTEFSAINVNFFEIEPILKEHIKQELKKSNYFELKNDSDKLYLTVTNDKSYFKDVFNNENISKELKDLIDKAKNNLFNKK